MNHGAYMYHENNRHILFVYAKLPYTVLSNAIPLSYKMDGGEYLIAYFDGGRDYLGQSKYENICEIIEKSNMVDIENNDYEEVKKSLPELTEKEYNDNLVFCKEQLDNISKENLDNINDDIVKKTKETLSNMFKNMDKDIQKTLHNSYKLMNNNMSSIINGTYDDVQVKNNVKDFSESGFSELKNIYNNISDEQKEYMKLFSSIMSSEDLYNFDEQE
jgi:hypothetical protein